jgi:hypothetical protein
LVGVKGCFDDVDDDDGDDDDDCNVDVDDGDDVDDDCNVDDDDATVQCLTSIWVWLSIIYPRCGHLILQTSSAPWVLHV